MTEVVGTRKIAIIGAGLMGTWHAHAVRRLGGRLAAVVDPNEPAARKLAAAAGAPIYASVEALLAGQAIDAAHLCTPPATHGPLSRQLIDAGVDLLVEKPFGATAAEAGELLDLAAAAGRQICPVYQLPFQRGMTRALAWLPAIGRPVHWRFAVRSAGAAGLPAAETEAIMRDILPHPLSVLAAAMPGSLPAVAWQAAAGAVRSGRIVGVSGCSPAPGAQRLQFGLDAAVFARCQRAEFAIAAQDSLAERVQGGAFGSRGRWRCEQTFQKSVPT